MTAQSFDIPFVSGIQAAGDKSASTEFPPGKGVLKLEAAHNVHVRPEHADVLYVRPGVTLRGPQRTKRSTVATIDNKLALVQSDKVVLEDATNTFRSISDVPVVGEVATQRLQTTPTAEIMSVGYADYTPSSDSACVVQVTRDYGGTTLELRVQRKLNGNWQRYELLNQFIANVNAGTRRGWVFGNAAGGWTVFCGGATSATPSVAYRHTTAVDGTFTSITDLITSALIWDVVPYSNGWVVLYQDTTTNRLKIAQVNTSFAVSSTTTVTTSGATTPTVAGLVWLGSTTFHIWHGGYSADSDTLYMHQVVLGGASTSFLSQANACGSGNTLAAMSVGGSSSVATSGGSTEAASYCYVLGGSGPSQKVGRLFRSNTSAVASFNNYVGAFYPRSRLWTSPDFFGARLFGVQRSIYGVWHLNGGLTSQGILVESYPLVYHSVDLGSQSTITFDLVPRASSMWVSSDGSQAKAVFWSQDAKHCVLSHIGYPDTCGQIVSHSGFDVVLGGVPRYFDGVELVPAGLPQAPIFTLIPGSSGTLTAGAYAYAIVWEWVDSRGRRQQSPATIQVVTVGASGSVSIELDPSSLPVDERLFSRRTKPRGVVYRSQLGGSILNRAPEANTISLVSDTLLMSYVVSWADTGAINFANGEPLYTSNGGASELVSTALESTNLLRGYSDRFISVRPLFPESLNYTKTIRQGRGIEPNPALVMVLPSRITALACQDGNVYGFSADNVWALSPSFADDTGNGGGGVDPVPLSVGIGCTQPLSVIETAVGVFFVGPRGVYLIARGGGPPQYIGADVEPVFLDYPTVTGVAHNSRTHEVVWVLTNGSDHRVLVFNYQVGQWFTWRIGSTTTHAAEITTMLGGVTLLPAGFVFGERGSQSVGAAYACSDAATVDTGSGGTAQLPIEVQSRDIGLAIGAMTRVLSMSLEASGDPSSAVLMSESHDSGATWSTERTINTGSPNPPIYQFVKQKTRGVRFRIRTTTGVSPTVLSGVSLRISGLGKSMTGNAYRRG